MTTANITRTLYILILSLFTFNVYSQTTIVVDWALDEEPNNNQHTCSYTQGGLFFPDTTGSGNGKCTLRRALREAGAISDDAFCAGCTPINEELADIPPNGTVVIRDVVGEYWASILGSNGNGSLIVAAYEADTLEDDGTRVYKNVIVNARIFNKARQWIEDPDNEGEFLDRAAWYGQLMPGVPWYNFADGGAVGEDFDFSYEELTGGEEGSGLRFNVGFVNASDPQTTLTVGVQPFQANGEPFLDADEVEIRTTITMPAASHVQLFRPFRDEWDLPDVENATVRVSILGWSSIAAEPVVMLTSYGSVVANNTNDPSTVLPRFAYPYDVECMWNGGGEELDQKGRRATHRPVEIPPTY